MFTKEFLYELLLIVCSIIQILVFLYILWKSDLKKYYIIFFKVIPFYKKLEKEYNAKYPTFMADVYNLRSFNIDERDELETFFFVSNSSFHIVSSTRPDLHIKIPFESVLYQNCSIRIYSKYNYYYRINLGLLVDNNKILEIAFDTLEYNHRIDKKYGARLSGEELYFFIKEALYDEETFKNSPFYRKHF